MALNIKDAETELLVRALSRRRGISLTEAVRQAVKRELDSDALPESEKAKRIAEGRRWLEEFYRERGIERPVRPITKQEMDDIIGYDDNGLL